MKIISHTRDVFGHFRLNWRGLGFNRLPGEPAEWRLRLGFWTLTP